MDDKALKNKPYIDKANKMIEKIDESIRDVKGSFNNRETSLTVTKLEEAKFWLQAFIETLKS